MPLVRLASAERRLDELLALNGGDLGGADPYERQQLFQEFFFHLIGAIEFLARYVNEKRSLSILPEDVSVPVVVRKLGNDSLAPKLKRLYADVRKTQMPDPYSDSGYVYRAWVYRNLVTHRRPVPWVFMIGGDEGVSLTIDPRDWSSGTARKTIDVELRYLFTLIGSWCGVVLADA
jgi:hypothetical protein